MKYYSCISDPLPGVISHAIFASLTNKHHLNGPYKHNTALQTQFKNILHMTAICARVCVCVCARVIPCMWLHQIAMYARNTCAAFSYVKRIISAHIYSQATKIKSKEFTSSLIYLTNSFHSIRQPSSSILFCTGLGRVTPHWQPWSGREVRSMTHSSFPLNLSCMQF